MKCIKHSEDNDLRFCDGVTEPPQSSSSSGIDVSMALNTVNDYAGAVGLEASLVEAAIDYGINSGEDLGKAGKTASKVLKGIGALGFAISLIQAGDELAQKNPNYKAASIYGVDATVGLGAIILTTAVVGPLAPFIAAGAITYGVSRLFWGPGSD